MADEKKRMAVALGYELGDDAPKILATGQGYVADKIIETAQAANIPMHKDVRLANALSKLELDDYIPPELYEVVAEVLLFVDRVDHIKNKLKKDSRYE